MKTYSFYGFVAREATLRVAAAKLPMARFEKLRFGLAFMPLTEELAAALKGNFSAASMSLELERLNRGAFEWAITASRRGPLCYIEAEVEAGSGWHAGVSWSSGDTSMRPLRLEDREPVLRVLKDIGVVADPGRDVLSTLKLDVTPPPA